MNAQQKPVNYWDYIRVEDLLDLQGGLPRDESGLANDEVLFITVHQVFELWFKLILRELSTARDLFRSERVAEQELSGAVRSLRRCTTILRVATQHFAVMETMTPRDYLAFRDKLMGASGFQSAQFRQLEILMGLPEERRISLGLEGTYREALRDHGGARSPALARVEAQLADRPSLREALHAWLHRTPIDGVGPDDEGAERTLDDFLDRYLTAHAAEVDQTANRAHATAATDTDRDLLTARFEAEKQSVRRLLDPTDEEGGAHLRRVRAAMVFIETYRDFPLLAWPREVLESIVQLEQHLTVFRQRHARMVERMIGRRTGTGGSAGVAYLDQTALEYRVFEDLWAVRTILLRRESAPDLPNAAYYGFAVP